MTLDLERPPANEPTIDTEFEHHLNTTLQSLQGVIDLYADAPDQGLAKKGPAIQATRTAEIKTQTLANSNLRGGENFSRTDIEQLAGRIATADFTHLTGVLTFLQSELNLAQKHKEKLVSTSGKQTQAKAVDDVIQAIIHTQREIAAILTEAKS